MANDLKLRVFLFLPFWGCKFLGSPVLLFCSTFFFLLSRSARRFCVSIHRAQLHKPEWSKRIRHLSNKALQSKLSPHPESPSQSCRS